MKRTLWMLLSLVLLLLLGATVQQLTAQAGLEQAIADPTGDEFFPMDPLMRSAGAGIGLLLLGSWLAAQCVRSLKIPKITAYLLFGLLVGPSVLSIIGKEEIEFLGFMNDLAIALIGLAAGSEIQPSLLKRYARALVIFFVINIPLILLGVTALVVMGGPVSGLVRGMGFTQLGAIGLIVGTVAVASSPAVVIAILRETKAKGVMSNLCLSLTVCKDLVLVVLFAVTMAFADTVLVEGDGGGRTGEEVLLYLAQHIGGSIVFGVITGVLIALAAGRMLRNESIFVILTGFGIAVFSGLLKTEPIIVAVIAGLVLENIWPSRTRRLFATVEELSLPVFCIFFALAGAKIDLEILSTMWVSALAVVAARSGLIWLGTWLAMKASGVEPPIRTWMWTGMIPQAGISLALATIVGETFADRSFGPELFNLLLAMIAIHELAGPALFKLGLVRANEVPSMMGRG